MRRLPFGAAGAGRAPARSAATARGGGGGLPGVVGLGSAGGDHRAGVLLERVSQRYSSLRVLLPPVWAGEVVSLHEEAQPQPARQARKLLDGVGGGRGGRGGVMNALLLRWRRALARGTAAYIMRRRVAKGRRVAPTGLRVRQARGAARDAEAPDGGARGCTVEQKFWQRAS